MNYTYFVDLGSIFFITFIIGAFLESMVVNLLQWINSDKMDLKNRISKIRGLGELAGKLFSQRKVTKAMKYKETSEGFSGMTSSIQSGISTILVIFGILPFIVWSIHSFVFPDSRMVWSWILASIVTSSAATLFGIPFGLYNDFVIEDRFGFNTKTRKTFFLDVLKGFVIGSLITVGLQLVLDFALTRFGKLDVYGVICCIITLFFIAKVIQWFSVNVMFRMFNKFKPLQDKMLKKKIDELCRRCGFKVSGIEVMDASKRTKHSNAFICGPFWKKRIILFDTIFKTLTHDEILGIIAHEIGHGKLRHLAITDMLMMIWMTSFTAISFVLMKTPYFYSSFGYTWVNETNIEENYIIGFSLASAFISSISWIVTPVSNWISRKMEYSADRYAASVIKKRESFENAILKLTSENLSDVAPHPAYEFVNYTHPSIYNRITAIRKNENQEKS